MKMIYYIGAGLVLAGVLGFMWYAGLGSATAVAEPTDTRSLYDYTLNSLDGKATPLASYKGKVVVAINVASKCGLTPQYADIQVFYEKYKAKGVVVLGFPANNFGAQEPGTHSEIAEFCQKNYGVSFPMFEKISVKGEDMHPLYRYLTEATGSPVAWNFQKFVVGKDGKVLRSFSPKTSVTDPEFIQAIEAQL